MNPDLKKTRQGEKTLENAYIHAQNVCVTASLRKQIRLAWNDFGAHMISEAALLEVFASCERHAIASHTTVSAVEKGDLVTTSIWPTPRSWRLNKLR